MIRPGAGRLRLSRASGGARAHPANGIHPVLGTAKIHRAAGEWSGILDVFIEQIIKKRKTAAQWALEVLLIVAAAALIAALAFVMVFGMLGPFSMFAGLLALGVGYGAWRLATSLSVEFEYSVTNGIFDVDRIVAQRSRKRLVSSKCEDFEEFGKYDPARLQGRTFDTRIMAANPDAENLYYGVVRVKDLGRVLVVFEPNDKVLATVKRFLPAQVRERALRGN